MDEKPNLDPNPFCPDPESADKRRSEAADNIMELIYPEPYDREVRKRKYRALDLERDCLEFHLCYSHYKGDGSYYKYFGQRYWSKAAYDNFQKKFERLGKPLDKKIRPDKKTLPRRSEDKKQGVLFEHVVPKAVSIKYLLTLAEEIKAKHSEEDTTIALAEAIANVLDWNLGAVVTAEESSGFGEWHSTHPDVKNLLHTPELWQRHKAELMNRKMKRESLEGISPWRRYALANEERRAHGKEPIQFIEYHHKKENGDYLCWTEAERDALREFNLIAPAT